MKKLIAATGLSLMMLSGCSVVEGFNQDPELAIFKKDVQPLVKAYIKENKNLNVKNLRGQLIEIFDKETPGRHSIFQLCSKEEKCGVENNIGASLYDDHMRAWKISAEEAEMLENLPKKFDYLKNKTSDNPAAQEAINSLKMDYVFEKYEKWKKIPDQDKLDKQKLKQLSNKSK